jgi:hypothetical protein
MFIRFQPEKSFLGVHFTKTDGHHVKTATAIPPFGEKTMISKTDLGMNFWNYFMQPDFFGIIILISIIGLHRSKEIQPKIFHPESATC